MAETIGTFGNKKCQLLQHKYKKNYKYIKILWYLVQRVTIIV